MQRDCLLGERYRGPITVRGLANAIVPDGLGAPLDAEFPSEAPRGLLSCRCVEFCRYFDLSLEWAPGGGAVVRGPLHSCARDIVVPQPQR